VGAVVPSVRTLDIADEDKGDKRQIVNVSLFFFGGWGMVGGEVVENKAVILHKANHGFDLRVYIPS